MSSTESFDELEQKIAERIEEALAEVRGEFLERLQGARDRLDEVVQSEVATAKQEAESAAASFADAEQARAAALAEVEEVRSLLNAAEEAKEAAIAEALETKEAEFAEMLGARDSAISEAEQARDAALAEAEQAKSALMAEAEESKSALLAEAEDAKAIAIAAALEAKEGEFSEARAAAEEAAQEEMQAALAEARAAAEEAARGAVDDALQQIHDLVVKIDVAQTQSEILEALLAGSAVFTSRSLVFLTQEDGLHGWGAQGFHTDEGAVQEAHLEYREGSAWAELSEGRGTVLMSGEACRDLCGGIDGSAPEEGVLIPLVLRDRLAAALYADRLEEGSTFHLAMLQLLTFVAGQVLESLPLRERSSTATLRLVTEAPTDEPGLELWQYQVPEEPIEEYVPEEIPEPESIPAEPEEMTAAEAVVEEVAPVEAIPESMVEDYQDTAESAGFEVEEAVEEPMEAIEDVDELAAPVIEEPMVEEPAPEMEAPVEVAPTTEVAPATEVAPPTEVSSPAAGAEVAPPEDVDGPGWAFTTRRFSSEGGDDVGHEEARRLARLLVTEIKLYNEEQVEEGRRGRNIYRTLQDDIDRSRQIYEERIEEAIRTDTDYFREELVKILAAGDEEVMGM